MRFKPSPSIPSSRAFGARFLLPPTLISLAVVLGGPTVADEIGPLRRNTQGEIVPVSPAQSTPQSGDPLLGTPRRDAKGNIVVVPVPQAAPTQAATAPAAPAAVPAATKAAASPPSVPAPPRPATAVVHAGPPGPNPAASVTASPLACAADAVTCVEIDEIGQRREQQIPITFGQPFAPGDLPAGSTLIAKDSAGSLLPLQMDQPASHYDGSIRFAILSTVIPDLPAKGHVLVNLFKAAPKEAQPTTDGTALIASGYDMTVTADVYAPQITRIMFGDRNGQQPGTPFLEGEAITLALGDRAADRHTLTITKELAGGGWPTLSAIADAFTKMINASQGGFTAYRLGDAYENLWVVPRQPPGTAFTVKFSYAGKGKLQEFKSQDFRPTRHYAARTRPLLERAKLETWLRGPVVTEFLLMSPLLEVGTGTPHPQLTARFDVRVFPQTKRVRTDVTIENDWSYEPSPGNASYDIVIRANDATVFQQKNLTHYHHARWHKVFWNGEPPAVHVRYQTPYLFRSRMVPTYDTSIVIPEAVIAADADRLRQSNSKPLGPAFITEYMPMTGGRPDIGPLPRWAALYLLTQDPRLEAVLLANGDAAGSVPIHYRDRPTDQPVSLDDHPGLAMMFGRAGPNDGFPGMSVAETPWTPDSAHQPSLAYLPYLVTGDKFYLDELMLWANWDMGIIDPTYREQGRGLVQSNQVRAQAWSLRTIGEAVLALPDKHPMKAYFARKLHDNLQWYVEHYVHGTVEKGVQFSGWIGDDVIAPWQNDFFFLSVGRMAAAGDPTALELTRWMANFVVGRWLHEPDGYCLRMAPAYYIKTRDKNGQPLRSWAELFRMNWPDQKSCPMTWVGESSSDSPLGYVANGRAALGLAASLGIDGAARAFQRVTEDAPTLVARMSEDPTWALVPGPLRVDGPKHN